MGFSPCHAEQASDPENTDPNAQHSTANNLVQREVFPNWTTPYKERRARFGFLTSLAFAPASLGKFKSPVDSASASDLFGGSTQLGEFEVAPKINFGPISSALFFGYAGGESKVTGSSGSVTMLSLTRKSVGLEILLDGLFSEPWVVPYGRVGMFIWDYRFSSGTSEYRVTSVTASSMRLGLLLQLNELDKNSTSESRKDYELENAFLDLFTQQSGGIDSTTQANLEASTQLGVGIRLEF